LSFALYVYQLSSAGDLSYYFPKTTAILLTIAAAFAIPAVAVWYERFGLRHLAGKPVLGALFLLACFSLVIIGTGQSLAPSRLLAQPNSKVNYDVAKRITTYLAHEDPAKTSLVVLRNVDQDEDKHGYLVGKLANEDFTCAYWINDFRAIATKLQRLDECANQSHKKFIVITSDKTKDLVANLHNPAIKIVNIP
jgi:phosphoglycerol transferase MdoB-like AlkP superfamily enzyme